ncbi:MAG: TIGR03067 domain-containing protein [Planctomycetes bacterium]|nr:TIGR03067 domain-containing protein [Planctomycetota bacterium]
MGTVTFEVGYRNQTAFFANGTATVKGVVYHLQADETKKENPFTLYYNVVSDKGKDGERIVGWGTASLAKEFLGAGYFALGKDQYYVVKIDAEKDAKNPDLDRLQGKWRVERVSTPAVFGEGQKDVRLEYEFSGTTYKVFRNGVLSYIADFKLGTAKEMKTIDEKGAAPWSSTIGTTRLGIYSLDGDNLVLAYTLADPALRPTDMKEGPARTIAYLKRVK